MLGGLEVDYGKNEYDVAGGIRGKPLEVVRAPYTGLPVPASAEPCGLVGGASGCDSMGRRGAAAASRIAACASSRAFTNRPGAPMLYERSTAIMCSAAVERDMPPGRKRLLRDRVYDPRPRSGEGDL